MLTKNFWGKYFKEYDFLNELIPYRELLNTICSYSNPQPGGCVLDVGSGTGNLSMLLESFGTKVTSIDFSKEGIEIHKAKKPKAYIINLDISKKLPFTDNEFDSIVSNNVLYTIPKEKRSNILRELYRVLKPGGNIVISNILKGFKPHYIYFDHVKMLLSKHGITKTSLKILALIWPTIKILYYNHLINTENKCGFYDFFKEKEQSNLLMEAGFKKISEDLILYSGQAVLNWGIK